jgi:hypothetical protein
MAEILVRGDNSQAAADELAVAIRDIFAADPVRRVMPDSHAPETRTGAEVIMIALSLPPAVTATADIISRAQLGERVKRLIAKVAALHKSTGARVLIDPGNGHPIPLEEARRQDILTALRQVEQRLKR